MNEMQRNITALLRLLLDHVQKEVIFVMLIFFIYQTAFKLIVFTNLNSLFKQRKPIKLCQ